MCTLKVLSVHPVQVCQGHKAVFIFLLSYRGMVREIMLGSQPGNGGSFPGFRRVHCA